MRLTHGVRHWKETTFVDDLGKLTQSCTNLAESVSPPVAVGGTCACSPWETSTVYYWPYCLERLEF